MCQRRFTKNVQAAHIAVWGCSKGHVSDGYVCSVCAGKLMDSVVSKGWMCGICVNTREPSTGIVVDIILSGLHICGDCGKSYVKKRDADICRIDDILTKRQSATRRMMP